MLQDVSFAVPSGANVALVGSSGSGKSTIFHLIESFYTPLRGNVSINGCDVHDIQDEWLRSRVAVVSQEPVLFSGTIEENILFGICRKVTPQAFVAALKRHPERARAWRERVIEAAKMANAHGFVARLPSAYETEVGERGAQLSGGQKQRIGACPFVAVARVAQHGGRRLGPVCPPCSCVCVCFCVYCHCCLAPPALVLEAIARAILADPAILLLDEATSALDSESEALVQSALDRASQNRTTLIIAHRLSTIQRLVCGVCLLMLLLSLPLPAVQRTFLVVAVACCWVLACLL